MKKIFIVLIFLLSCVSASCAASEDMSVYVRQDVFDAKMEALKTEIQLGNERLFNEIRLLNTKIEALDKRITDTETHMLNRIADSETRTDNRIDDLKTMVYWGFSIIGLLVAFAIFAPSLGEFLRNLRQPSFTLEDVKRLIAEAKLNGTPIP